MLLLPLVLDVAAAGIVVLGSAERHVAQPMPSIVDPWQLALRILKLWSPSSRSRRLMSLVTSLSITGRRYDGMLASTAESGRLDPLRP